jgi:DNA-binding LacI/PurR family transcriptional regulator
LVQPAYDIGFRAADLLLDRIERVDGLEDTVTIRLNANLKVRESSHMPGRRRWGA